MILWRSSFHLLISFCCVDTAGLLGLHSPDLAAKKTCETPPRPKAKLRNPEPCTGSSQNTLLSSGWNGPSGNGESGLVEHDGTIQVTSPFMEYRHNYGIDWHTHKLKRRAHGCCMILMGSLPRSSLLHFMFITFHCESISLQKFMMYTEKIMSKED